MLVKDNLLVIRMDVAGLTQWGSSWGKEGAGPDQNHSGTGNPSRFPPRAQTTGRDAPAEATGMQKSHKNRSLRERRHSKELWKAVEKIKDPLVRLHSPQAHFAGRERRAI